MPDFSALYKKPVGEAKRPPTLPGGSYPGIIRQYEFVESREKKTPGVKYYLTLTDWPSDGPTSWSEVDEEGKTWEYNRVEIDLSKRQQELTFYFPINKDTGEPTDTSMYMFEQFVKTTNVPWEGMSYEQIFPSLVGTRVLVDMVQQLSQNNRVFCSAQKMTGLK